MTEIDYDSRGELESEIYERLRFLEFRSSSRYEDSHLEEVSEELGEVLEGYEVSSAHLDDWFSELKGQDELLPEMRGLAEEYASWRKAGAALDGFMS